MHSLRVLGEQLLGLNYLWSSRHKKNEDFVLFVNNLGWTAWTELLRWTTTCGIVNLGDVWKIRFIEILRFEFLFSIFYNINNVACYHRVVKKNTKLIEKAWKFVWTLRIHMCQSGKFEFKICCYLDIGRSFLACYSLDSWYRYIKCIYLIYLYHKNDRNIDFLRCCFWPNVCVCVCVSVWVFCINNNVQVFIQVPPYRLQNTLHPCVGSSIALLFSHSGTVPRLARHHRVTWNFQASLWFGFFFIHCFLS
jgi:hypothetical protein